MNKAHLILFLRILMGGLFIFSGIAKLDSIYQFEQAIFKAGIENWSIIPYLSRFIIIAEIFLGICFFHKEGLKKFTIPATFAMLVVFTIHLGYTIATEGGSSGNCGCFGEKIPMTPWESVIKNFAMMGILVYLFKAKIEKATKEETIVPISMGALSLLLVAVFFPIKAYVTDAKAAERKDIPVEQQVVQKDTTSSTLVATTTTEKVDTKVVTVSKNKKNTTNGKVTDDKKETVEITPVVVKDDGPKLMPKATSKFAPFTNFSNGVVTDLDAGIKIVTMYNTGCDHCQENAKQMCELKKKVKLPDVRILFWGNESEIPEFFVKATCNTPYKFLEPQVFFPILGKGNFPKIFLLNNGNIVGEWEGDDAVQKLEEAVKKL